MRKVISWPSAVSIAGSDSGGGAGLQADLRTFAALRVHGLSVLTAVTAQNPDRVIGIQPVSSALIRKQLEAVFESFRPLSVKTGMLFSAEAVRVVADFLGRTKQRPFVIVDPVMVSTSGTRLLKRTGERMLRERLLAMAGLVTPNLGEAEVLSGLKIGCVQEMCRAARAIYSSHGCAVLVKGGHLQDMRQAVDVFYDGKREMLLTQPFVRNVRTHGTGCTYASAIAAQICHGHSLAVAVRSAKRFVTQAIAGRIQVSGQTVLNPVLGQV